MALLVSKQIHSDQYYSQMYDPTWTIVTVQKCDSKILIFQLFPYLIGTKDITNLLMTYFSDEMYMDLQTEKPSGEMQSVFNQISSLPQIGQLTFLSCWKLILQSTIYRLVTGTAICLVINLSANDFNGRLVKQFLDLKYRKKETLGAISVQRYHFICIGTSIVKTGQSYDCLLPIMGVPILVQGWF